MSILKLLIQMRKPILMTFDRRHFQKEARKNYGPYDLFREAGQNSLDAYATELYVNLTPNIVTQDNGIGIPKKDFGKIYFKSYSTHKLRKNPPPPPWFQGEDREIMLERFKNIRGRKGFGKISFIVHSNKYKLLTRCAEESKVREYEIDLWGRADLRYVEPDGFPEHGTAIVVEKPKRKIPEHRVIEYLSKVFFPIISNDTSQGHIITPYSDPLFNIFVNEKKVEPMEWPDGIDHDVDISGDYGDIKGKIIEPFIIMRRPLLYLYNRGIFVSEWAPTRHVTGYILEDFLDLITWRTNYVKNNRQWRVFSGLIEDFIRKEIPLPEFRPTKTSPKTLLSAVKVLKKAVRIYERDQIPTSEQEKTRKPITKKYTPKKRPYRPQKRDFGLGERVTTIYFRGKPFDLYVDSYSPDDKSVFAVRSNRPREHDRIILNDASLELEIIRQIESEKTRSALLADRIAWGIAELTTEYDFAIEHLFDVHKNISKNIMGQLIKL